MKPDQERVKALLTDTVTLLCKNGLHYSKEMKVQGLLGITLDENDVFVVHINEKFGDLIGGEVSLHADEETKAESSPDKKPKHHKSHSDAEPPRARKRRNSRDSPDSPSPSKHHKDSRTYSTDSDSSSRVPPLSSPSHSGSAPGTPGDATPRIKKEEEVIFLDAEGEQRSSCSRDSVSRRDDRNAMQQTYSNLSLTDIQSGFAQLEQVPGVDMPGSMDSVAGSPAKHKPGEGFQAPFVTGMMRHQGPGSQSGGEGDSSSGSAWDNSALSNLSQMNPDGSDSSGWSQSQMQAQSQNTAGSQGGENSSNLPYVCHLCHKAMRSTSVFYRHMKQVHGIAGRDVIIRSTRVFTCPIPGCQKHFSHDTGLSNHTKRIHGLTRTQALNAARPSSEQIVKSPDTL